MSIRHRLVSVLAGKASEYIRRKRPSDIIPFRGNFPIIDDMDMYEYREAIESTEMIEDLPEKWQRVVMKGTRCSDFEESFKRYLLEYGLYQDDFLALKNIKKANKLADWMERSCISWEALYLK